MVDVYLPMMKAAAIISAGQLRLFEALSNGPMQLPALAAAIGASEIGAGHLTDFLIAIGYLVQTDSGIGNAPHAERWFTGRGGVDYTAGLLWTAESWSLMSNLTASVRKGAPEKTLWKSMQERPHWGPIFSSYMHAFAQHLGPDLLAQVKLPSGSRKLLDLGGSHGLHSIGFCREYPGLNAVIVDLPSALTETQATLDTWADPLLHLMRIERLDNDEVIQICTCGWRAIPVPADYDGDGFADPAVRSLTINEWIVMFSSGNYTPISITVSFD